MYLYTTIYIRTGKNSPEQNTRGCNIAFTHAYGVMTLQNNKQQDIITKSKTEHCRQYHQGHNAKHTIAYNRTPNNKT